MLTPDKLHGYQKRAVNFQCSNPHTMLWLDMGLGKTSITLTSIKHLLATKFLKAVIVVAPIRVTRLVWKQEAAKWEHTKNLTFSSLTGTKDQRTRALLRPSDVYLINYENLGWLAEVLQTYYIKKGLPIPIDGVVWDEVSKCKNSNTQRVKSVKKILDHFKWSTGLTGTPASNGYKDLHGQFLVVDKGQRLGTSKTAFRSRFYKKVGPFKEVAHDGAEDTIKQLIGDITLEMSAAEYNPLPSLIMNDVEVAFPPQLRTMYEKMEQEFFLTLDSGTEIEVFNQASLTNKCLQFSNGAMYPIPGVPVWEPVHDLKLEALEDIIDELQGNPVLCSYAYRSDAERIMTKFKHLDPINLTECKSEKTLTGAMTRWKKGDCQLMIGHPACLHPKTQVLTELRGWVNLIDVLPHERVHDGVEFVSHDGCSYSGIREVVDVFGITMTPNHKLLVGNEWMEADYVRNNPDLRDEAVFEWEKTPSSSSEVSELPIDLGDNASECHQEQPHRKYPLSALHSEYVSQIDEHQNMEYLARHEVEACVKSTHVYDLVNCGPRNRFLIRNAKGEMFISHNSMGHGIDGLQDMGHTLVWFGLTWSLDLYEQFNARIRRQGQGKPVTCHRIMTSGTLDQAQALALNEKSATEKGLRSAISEYRKLKGIL